MLPLGCRVASATVDAPLTDYRWRWHAADFEAAAAAGVFGSDAKVELWDGEVLAVPSMLPGHAEAVGTLCQHAFRLDETIWSVGSQVPVRLSDVSEPEPDLWVARGRRGSFWGRHPGPAELVLVVEVADSSLSLDRDVKIPGYAAAGVPEAWLLSLPERLLTVHRHPLPDAHRYQSVAVLEPAATVTHEATGLAIPVGELLPPVASP